MLPQQTKHAAFQTPIAGGMRPYRARHEDVGVPSSAVTEPDPLRAGQRRRWVRVAEAATLFAILTPLVLHATLGISISAVLSDSMRPEYSAGDLVVTRPTPATDIQLGQIAVVEDPTRDLMHAHRVVWLTPAGSDISITTRGDANPADDTPVTVARSASVPVVIASIPLLGYLVAPLGRPLVALLGLGLLLSADVIAVLITLFPRAGTARSTVERVASELEGR